MKSWRLLAFGTVALLLLSVLVWRLIVHRQEGKKSTQATTSTDTEGMAQAHHTRGQGYFEKKQYKEAIDAFTQAIGLKSNYALAYTDRGRAYIRLGQNDRKMEDYEHAEENYWRAMGDWDHAIEDFNHVLQLDPNSDYAYACRGDAYFYKGEHDRAVESYDQALKINPNDATVYVSRGVAYDYLLQHDLAIQDFNQALKIDPNYRDAYLERGVTYAHKGQYDRAIQDYNHVLKINPNDANAYSDRAGAYEAKGEDSPSPEQAKLFYRRAIQDYDRALKIDPHLINTPDLRAVTLARLKMLMLN